MSFMLLFRTNPNTLKHDVILDKLDNVISTIYTTTTIVNCKLLIIKLCSFFLLMVDSTPKCNNIEAICILKRSVAVHPLQMMIE